ncbi:hypothetical protein [Streptomyces sp. NPDC002746]
MLGLTHDPFGWDLTDSSPHVASRLSAANTPDSSAGNIGFRCVAGIG